MDEKPSELWTRKMKTLFQRMDTDGNGYLTREDYELLGDRFEKYGELSTERMKRLRKSLTDWWDKMSKNKIKVELDEFMSARTQIIKSEELKAKAENHFRAVLDDMFNAIDTDENGYISNKEYRTFFRCMGIDSDSDADYVFKFIDLDKDNQLCRQEFVNAGLSFLYAEEDTPFKNLLGPLI